MPTASNQIKGTLFAKSYARAQRAVAAGFYLEAISLAESLILDRLTVILNSNVEGDYSKFSVGKACNNLISHKVVCFDEALWLDAQSWSRNRNSLSHKISAFDENTALSWQARLRLAKATALQGLAIANRCSREVRHHRL